MIDLLKLIKSKLTLDEDMNHFYDFINDQKYQLALGKYHQNAKKEAV